MNKRKKIAKEVIARQIKEQKPLDPHTLEKIVNEAILSQNESYENSHEEPLKRYSLSSIKRLMEEFYIVKCTDANGKSEYAALKYHFPAPSISEFVPKTMKYFTISPSFLVPHIAQSLNERYGEKHDFKALSVDDTLICLCPDISQWTEYTDTDDDSEDECRKVKHKKSFADSIEAEIKLILTSLYNLDSALSLNTY